MANPTDSFRTAVGQMLDQTRIAVIAALNMLGNDIVADLKSACPVITGTLKSSIRYETTEKNGNPLLVIHVGGDQAYYAPMVEYGTARIQKHPFVRPVMAKYKSRISEVIAGNVDTAIGNIRIEGSENA